MQCAEAVPYEWNFRTDAICLRRSLLMLDMTLRPSGAVLFLCLCGVQHVCVFRLRTLYDCCWCLNTVDSFVSYLILGP